MEHTLFIQSADQLLDRLPRDPKYCTLSFLQCGLPISASIDECVQRGILPQSYVSFWYSVPHESLFLKDSGVYKRNMHHQLLGPYANGGKIHRMDFTIGVAAMHSPGAFSKFKAEYLAELLNNGYVPEQGDLQFSSKEHLRFRHAVDRYEAVFTSGDERSSLLSLLERL